MNNLNKIILSIVALIAIGVTSKGQTFGNEWIDYNQSYAKFGVYEDGMYRISQAQLASAGITNPNGANLQIFRDGIQIPIFVSQSAPLGTTDYIEFYGQKADGKVDERLFRNPNNQMNKDQNLISDTAFYFITQSTAGPFSRFSQATNTITGSLTPEAFIWDNVRINFRGVLSQGPSYIGQSDNPIHYIRSSQFEQAEGWVNTFSTTAISEGLVLDGAYKAGGSPNVTINTTIAGFSYLATHRCQVRINGNLMADETFPKFSSKDFNLNFPTSYLTSTNQVDVLYSPLNSQPQFNLFDRIGVSKLHARYARTTDLGGFKNKYFELNPKSGSYYLEIDNFNGGSTAPFLFDLDTKVYYVADISVSNRARFLIPANTNLKRFCLVGRQNGASKVVNNLGSVTFKNYTSATNQGDYIILSHPYYYGGGTNFVEEYRKFRASTDGGSYTAIVASVEDIYNEFGYGYNFHAQSIRNFLSFSKKSPAWSNKSKFAFIIGKGILYSDYLAYSLARQQSPANYPYVPVPTFGIPASDVMLTDFDNDNIPELPIGRLSILNGAEIEAYLEKAKLHDKGIRNINNQYSDSVLWRKNILHVSGGKDANENAQILNPLNRQAGMMGDSNVGARTLTYAKSTTAAIQIKDTEEITDKINEGVGFVQFFGHGSSSTVDFGGFDNPSLYRANNRFPVFMANGCGVGNVFSVGAVKTLSEQWMDAPSRGGIGFIANSNVGYLYYLANYTDSLYKQFGQYSYGKTIGEQLITNIQNNFSYPNNLGNDIIRLHAEHILLQGDPAIMMFGLEKPDYAVEDAHFKIKQQSITTKVDSFDVELVVYNLGRYTKDSMDLRVERTLPNNITEVLINKRYAGLAFSDTLNFRVSVGGQYALGNNAFTIKIDDQSEIDEVAEYNNELIKTFVVYNDDLEPVYPYEFSIVTKQDITLKASTLNPFLDTRQYVFQMDTTEGFNSPSLQTHRINAKGGVVKWKPTFTYNDSTVYYWRTAMDTLYGSKVHRWTPSSFIYLANSTPGWNQSHFYQYRKDNFQNLIIDSAQQDFQFTSLNKKLQIQNVCLYGPNPYFYSWADYTAKINGVTLYTDGCSPFGLYRSMQFMLIDSLTGLPWHNTNDPNNPNYGLYGSWKPCRGTSTNAQADYFFEFSFYNTAWRQTIMNFIDSIPDGVYVMMQPRLCVSGTCGGTTTELIDTWKADSATLGTGNTLYHKIKNMGFTDIDSLYKNRSMIFFMQKGFLGSVQQAVGADSTVKLYKEFTFSSYLYEGKMVTNKIGPATQWTNFHRSGFSLDNGQIGDTVAVEIYGIDNNNNETLLATVWGDTSLSFVDAVSYPELRLVMNQKDNNFSTPEQVKYWRVHYTPVPEAAINPNAHIAFMDSLGQGQQSNISVAIENLTEIPMDSMLVKFSLIDANSVETQFGSKRFAPLAANDTIHVNYTFDSKGLSGNYLFKIEANPDNDQIEQYHPNNIGLNTLSVAPDNENPILDVTFDGIHILNRDVVSAKPNILISLKDENPYLALDDTTAMQVSLRYPDNPNVDIAVNYSDANLRFYPGNPSSQSENKARIEFAPTFLKDGIYELIVKGKDRTGNKSGNVDYKVAFEVITKSSITSVLNYPNPFSTQTQFVFTLTGSEVPEQFKIQIYSITGKVVREISRAEIGNIHIGRNITDFRWKGDDQFGDLLGNGVYLYRVATRLNGQEMDKADNDADGAGKWMQKGFGKLYIMR